tara:strand:+ start:5713 stop:5967 length:255 start_codon:yes stop_codon:yes gene_type:complete
MIHRLMLSHHCVDARNIKWKLSAGIMSFKACPQCMSIRIYPYMGFMTGQQYQCQDCENISPIIFEFDTEEAYKAVLQARLEEEE